MKGRRTATKLSQRLYAYQVGHLAPQDIHRRSEGRGPRPLRGTTLKVRCWCQRAEVDVPANDVSRGITGSCDRAICVPPVAPSG